MTGRIIDVSTPGTRLKVRHHQLVVAMKDHEEKQIPIEDISLLIINHPSTVLSQAVMSRLGEAKAAIIFCSNNQMPVSLSLLIAGHHAHAARLSQQINVSKPLKKGFGSPLSNARSTGRLMFWSILIKKL